MINFYVCITLSIIYNARSHELILETNITSYLNNSNLIVLNCSSSKPPIGNAAEFLYNNQSIASIGYFNKSCHVMQRTCAIEECICTNYYYVLLFKKDLMSYQKSFTCQMRFNQTTGSGHELKYKTVIYNGSEIIGKKDYSLKTDSSNVSHPKDYSKFEENSGTSNVLLFLTIGVQVPFILTLAIVGVMYCATDKFKSRNDARQKQEAEVTSIPLLDNFTSRNDARQKQEAEVTSVPLLGGSVSIHYADFEFNKPGFCDKETSTSDLLREGFFDKETSTSDLLREGYCDKETSTSELPREVSTVDSQTEGIMCKQMQMTPSLMTGTTSTSTTARPITSPTYASELEKPFNTTTPAAMTLNVIHHVSSASNFIPHQQQDPGTRRSSNNSSLCE